MADPIKFVCPGCKTKYSVPASRAGQTSKCRRCGGVITVPAVSSAPTPAPVPDPPPAETSTETAEMPTLPEALTGEPPAPPSPPPEAGAPEPPAALRRPRLRRGLPLASTPEAPAEPEEPSDAVDPARARLGTLVVLGGACLYLLASAWHSTQSAGILSAQGEIQALSDESKKGSDETSKKIQELSKALGVRRADYAASSSLVLKVKALGVLILLAGLALIALCGSSLDRVAALVALPLAAAFALRSLSSMGGLGFL